MPNKLYLYVPMYRVQVFGFLFVDKGVISERGYKEHGRGGFDDKYLAGEF